MKKFLLVVTLLIFINITAGASDNRRAPAVYGMFYGTATTPAVILEGMVRVEGTSSFYIGIYEVTQKEWMDVMGSNPSHFKGDDLPVENVSWLDAVKYCNKRSLKEGLTPTYREKDGNIIFVPNANGYRLPTEAEWAYAALGGHKSDIIYAYSGSEDLDAVAWYEGNSDNKTHPVGSKMPNALGLYDMSGNVLEWCWDWYEQVNSAGVVLSEGRVNRGGSWNDVSRLLRTDYRVADNPSHTYKYIGFRVVR